jgi:hypothetical protein
MSYIHKRNLFNASTVMPRPISSADISSLNDWRDMSCCMPRQNCGDRNSWKHASDPKLSLLNYSGIMIPLGNSNFLLETYHHCKPMPNRLRQDRREWCP